ncbi:MAG: hypothetical protein J6J36_06980 [Clostridia bacterium]|nr:hypothetical protein [Clostridia bacterium]
MKIIEYNLEDFKDICSMADFYEKVGLYDKENNEWGFEDVHQLIMDDEDCHKILEYLQANQKKQKDRYVRKLTPHQYLCRVNLDWANISPAMPKGDMIFEKSKLYFFELDESPYNINMERILERRKHLEFKKQYGGDIF